MNKKIQKLKAPFDDGTASALKAGENVRISGTLIAARDVAHKRMVDLLDQGLPLPIDLQGQVVYYVGPSPARPGEVIGSAGPTTAGRMDVYTPRLMAAGLKGMIGKGNRSEAVIRAIQQYRVPYLACVGGAGALIARCIKKYTVLAWPELGTEALAVMEVEDFPAIVVIDCLGNNYYEIGPAMHNFSLQEGYRT